MFTVGQEVRVNHEGDKDDRLVGTVEAIKDGRYRVWFGDSGGWYDESELEAA